MHVVPTWDHFRAAARNVLLVRYHTTQFEDVKVESMSRTESGFFQAIDAKNRNWIGLKVILATGISAPPQFSLPNNKSTLTFRLPPSFHCLGCHGYETRDRPSAGVLAIAGT
jgi:hypothetical protein